MVTLQEFNQFPLAKAVALLKPCLAIERWYLTIIKQRPYHHYGELEHCAKQINHFRHEEIQQALMQHPRIGEKKQEAPKKEAHFSSQEQASLGHQDSDMMAQIYQENLRYEERFNQVFLIRAKGRSYQEILTELKRRITNTIEQEQQEITEQLIQIALLRLAMEITP